MEDEEKVEDSQWTSSTYWSSYSAAHGPLYSTKGWRAEVNNEDQWILVDLGKKEIVSGIATQGGSIYGNGFYCCWVIAYSVKHSLNECIFEYYKDRGVDKVELFY